MELVETLELVAQVELTQVLESVALAEVWAHQELEVLVILEV